jgi:hypothetical protein
MREIKRILATTAIAWFLIWASGCGGNVQQAPGPTTASPAPPSGGGSGTPPSPPSPPSPPPSGGGGTSPSSAPFQQTITATVNGSAGAHGLVAARRVMSASR